MQNKKLIFIMSILILLIGASAFIGGKLLNREFDPGALGAPFAGDFRSMIIPPPQLPTTLPEVTGVFVELQDNTIIVETKPLETGGVSVSSENAKSQTGPLVDVLVTRETIIYRETTQPSEPLSAENQTIRQTVEQATLDDLDSQSMIIVWGRRSGDRIVAEVLMYSDLVAVKSAIFKDCEICP
jgi:hypothetical protein